MRRAWVGATPFQLAAKLVDVSMMRAITLAALIRDWRARTTKTPVIAPMTPEGRGVCGRLARETQATQSAGRSEAVKVARSSSAATSIRPMWSATQHCARAASSGWTLSCNSCAGSSHQLEVKNTHVIRHLSLWRPRDGRRRLDDGTQPAEQAAAKRPADLLRRLGARESIRI